MIAEKSKGKRTYCKNLTFVAPNDCAASSRSDLICFFAERRVKRMGQIIVIIKIKIVTIAVFPNQTTSKGKRANEGKLCITSSIGIVRDSTFSEEVAKSVRVIANKIDMIYAIHTLSKLSKNPKKNCFASSSVKPNSKTSIMILAVKKSDILPVCFRLRISLRL